MSKIIRARPKYILNSSDISKKHPRFNPEKEIFFNSGRSALQFLIRAFREYYKIQNCIKVGLQSFNCMFIPEVLLKENCELVIFDISLEDFSISLSELEKSSEKISILLLTHYQGIINQNYSLITSWCKKNGVMLIDDFAQSEYDRKKFKPISDFSIHSFAFDKPCSSLCGGSLKINLFPDKDFIYYLKKEYAKLKCEKKEFAELQLSVLKFVFTNSTKNRFKKGLQNYLLIQYFYKIKIPPQVIYFFFSVSGLKFIIKLLNKFHFFHSIDSHLYNIRKMHPLKINFIGYQRKNMSSINLKNKKEITALIRFLKKNGITPPSNYEEHQWNRFSVLDSNGKINKLLKDKEIEAGNFNWPKALHEIYSNNTKEFRNTEYAKENIVNIPIWSEEFQELEKLNQP